MKNAKQGLALIISNMKADQSGQDPRKKQSHLLELLGSDKTDEEVSDSEQFKAAMQDFILAVHKNDAELACEAYQDLQSLCPEKGEDHEDDEDCSNEGHEGLLDDEH